MSRHRAPRQSWFHKFIAPPAETPLEQATAAADLPIGTVTPTPVAAVVDLAERRQNNNPLPRAGGADIVMMTRPATAQTVEAVYPDGSVAQVPCELRVVATLEHIQDGMLLNLSGGTGGRPTAIAVTRSP